MVLPRKEDLVSLRRDLPGVFWSGLPLQPEVDMVMWVERLAEHSRLIHARLIRPGDVVDLSTRRDFNLEALGSDYLHLETIGQEMMVIARHITLVSACAGDPGATVVLKIAGQEVLFELSAGIMGRWDWLVNPNDVPMGIKMPFLAPCRLDQLFQQAAA